MNIRTTVQSLFPGPPASTFPTLSPQLPKWLTGNLRQITPLPCSEFSSGFRSRQKEISVLLLSSSLPPTPPPACWAAATLALFSLSLRRLEFGVSPTWNACLWLLLFFFCDCYFHLFRSLLRSSLLCQAAPPWLIFFLSHALRHRHQGIWSGLFHFALSPLLLCCALLCTVGMNSFFQAPLPSAFQAKPACGRSLLRVRRRRGCGE